MSFGLVNLAASNEVLALMQVLADPEATKKRLKDLQDQSTLIETRHAEATRLHEEATRLHAEATAKLDKASQLDFKNTAVHAEATAKLDEERRAAAADRARLAEASRKLVEHEDAINAEHSVRTSRLVEREAANRLATKQIEEARLEVIQLKADLKRRLALIRQAGLT